MLSNIEYLMTIGLVIMCVVLKLNVFPRLTAHIPRSLLVVFLGGLALLNVHVYRNAVERRLASPAEEKSLLDLRQALANEKRVGFISDENLDDSSDSLKRYFHTQYALMPIIVVEGTSPNLVIGNFDRIDSKAMPDDLILVRDFGPGLVLLRKRVQ